MADEVIIDAGIVLSLKDKFSESMKKAQSGFKSITESAKSANLQVKQVGESLQKSGKAISGFGAKMSALVTAPITAFGVASVMAFDKSANAMAQVQAGLKSTGNAVGFTSDELKQMASNLQGISLFESADILGGVTSQLLKFTNVTGTQFVKAQEAIINMSARMGTDLQSSATAIGKALNNPAEGLSGLSRAGVQFTQDQEDLINALVRTNRVADAQSLILKQLEIQFGGSAQASREAGAGAFKVLAIRIGDLSEKFGELIVKNSKPFLDMINKFINWLENLDESVMQNIITIGGLLAVSAPVIVAFGGMVSVIGTVITAVSSLSVVFTGLASAIGVIFSPVGLIIGAIAGLIFLFVNAYRKSETFRNAIFELGKVVFMAIEPFIEIGKVLFDILGVSADATGFFDALGTSVSIFAKSLSILLSPLTLVAETIKEIKNNGLSFDSIGNALANVGSNNIQSVKGIASSLGFGAGTETILPSERGNQLFKNSNNNENNVQINLLNQNGNLSVQKVVSDSGNTNVDVMTGSFLPQGI